MYDLHRLKVAVLRPFITQLGKFRIEPVDGSLIQSRTTCFYTYIRPDRLITSPARDSHSQDMDKGNKLWLIKGCSDRSMVSTLGPWTSLTIV
jgi:hypothetical protein